MFKKKKNDWKELAQWYSTCFLCAFTGVGFLFVFVMLGMGVMGAMFTGMLFSSLMYPIIKKEDK